MDDDGLVEFKAKVENKGEGVRDVRGSGKGMVEGDSIWYWKIEYLRELREENEWIDGGDVEIRAVSKQANKLNLKMNQSLK